MSEDHLVKAFQQLAVEQEALKGQKMHEVSCSIIIANMLTILNLKRLFLKMLGEFCPLTKEKILNSY